jgi:hypothetical protein
MVSGEECCGAAVPERVRDHGPARLEREPLPPVRAANVNAELVNAPRDVVRAEPAAPGELAGIAQEHRPVLDLVVALGSELSREALFHRLARESRARVDEPGHVGIAPQRDREVDVPLAPEAESQPFGLEKGAPAHVAGEEDPGSSLEVGVRMMEVARELTESERRMEVDAGLVARVREVVGHHGATGDPVEPRPGERRADSSAAVLWAHNDTREIPAGGRRVGRRGFRQRMALDPAIRGNLV